MRMENQQTPTISASGDVVVVRKPDVAYVTLFIAADGILLEDAVNQCASKVDEVQRKLREMYRDIRDIRTADISAGEPRATGFPRDKTSSPRPEAVKCLLVTIPPNPDLAVKIVDTGCRAGCSMASSPNGLSAGLNSQTGIVYGLTNPAEAQQEALARAVADAKEKASRLAKLIEKRVGPIKQISSSDWIRHDDMFRRHANPLLSRVQYLSTSAEAVEIPGKVSVGFELMD